MTLRTLEDGLALAGRLASRGRLVILGGGVIGLEVAAAARQRGVQVALLEAGNRLMARIAPPSISQWLLTLHRAMGVDIRLASLPTAIETSGSSLVVRAEDFERRESAFEADFVLAAIGVAPATECLEHSGIPLRNGVLVDEFCRVDRDPIYAIGDVANTRSPIYDEHVRLETWRNAENQARAVAEFLSGRTQPYVEVPWMWTDQLGRNIQIVGRWSEDAEIIERGRFSDPGSACLFLKQGVVTGGALIDQGRDRRFLEQMVVDRKARDFDRLTDSKIALRAFV